jgi:hypothetical protein
MSSSYATAISTVYVKRVLYVRLLMGLKERLSSLLLPPSSKNPADTARKVTVHEHMKNAVEDCRAHEQEMRDTMTQIIRSSKSNYRFKASTNGILVIIGTILIASPVAFAWLKSANMIPAMSEDDLMDLTNLNYFLGGIGIVAFVTTFFNKPQKQMTIAIADLAQLFLICNMYRLQFHTILGRLSEESNKEGIWRTEVVDSASKDLYHITKDAAQLLDNYIEKHARKDGDGNGYGNGKKEVKAKEGAFNNNRKTVSVSRTN